VGCAVHLSFTLSRATDHRRTLVPRASPPRVSFDASSQNARPISKSQPRSSQKIVYATENGIATRNNGGTTPPNAGHPSLPTFPSRSTAPISDHPVSLDPDSAFLSLYRHTNRSHDPYLPGYLLVRHFLALPTLHWFRSRSKCLSASNSVFRLKLPLFDPSGRYTHNISPSGPTRGGFYLSQTFMRTRGH
jgi:hypothetical protein